MVLREPCTVHCGAVFSFVRASIVSRSICALNCRKVHVQPLVAEIKRYYPRRHLFLCPVRQALVVIPPLAISRSIPGERYDCVEKCW
ncbi:hypothetical protein BDU57DRAFT_524648 [Ampelomyces quisqualis]|uniref:Uncharacterized protein n=1 Tax=Ampelomyces quisqualis TaxID=50730 RepID=A0A6A5Q6K5_AMPQU|nr:hypothetical protein BDU57DRAFT_524648 [Ampelomyces quisqualis]